MIESELENLLTVITSYNINYQIDLRSLLTVQVEILHATSHFKEQFPTCLQYARNLFDTVHESVKRVVNWSAYYFTYPQPYYPVPQSIMQLTDMPSVRPLSPIIALAAYEQATTKNWVNDFGKCVRQRTVRQETTKFKAGTLPLNMYHQSVVQLGKKVIFDNIAHPMIEETLQKVNNTKKQEKKQKHNKGRKLLNRFQNMILSLKMKMKSPMIYM
ncbi:unnamed protein product [Mytilus coruscus]|uniref:Uncharacterized protein n=1 Tax=Mytilus coruscus TaxID=42192 RepID=A0A6J8CJX1_MYTCO|nr:unnamed protein product [Mytilus coruscus]